MSEYRISLHDSNGILRKREARVAYHVGPMPYAMLGSDFIQYKADGVWWKVVRTFYSRNDAQAIEKAKRWVKRQQEIGARRHAQKLEEERQYEEGFTV